MENTRENCDALFEEILVDISRRYSFLPLTTYAMSLGVAGSSLTLLQRDPIARAAYAFTILLGRTGLSRPALRALTGKKCTNAQLKAAELERSFCAETGLVVYSFPLLSRGPNSEERGPMKGEITLIDLLKLARRKTGYGLLFPQYTELLVCRPSFRRAYVYERLNSPLSPFLVQSFCERKYFDASKFDKIEAAQFDDLFSDLHYSMKDVEECWECETGTHERYSECSEAAYYDSGELSRDEERILKATVKGEVDTRNQDLLQRVFAKI